MGCCATREGDSNSEKLIGYAETQLGLHLFTSFEIDRVAHRNSFNLQMTRSQLNSMIQALKIENSESAGFFHYFYDEQKNIYNAQQISTLGILLGKSQPSEKLKLLFENYDIDSSKTLGHNEISLMVNDILQISYKFIPRYSLKFFEGKDKLIIQNYESGLLSIRVAVANYLLDFISQESESQVLDMNEFSRVFGELSLKSLLSTGAIRRFGQLMLDRIFGTAMVIKNCIDNPDPVTRRRLTLVENYRRPSSLLTIGPKRNSN